MDPAKCTNCYACVPVCPTACNDARGTHVDIVHDECIGCGACIDACTHGARIGLDDTAAFLDALRRRERVVAIVAPAVAASFPDRWRNLNGWLLAQGVSAVFDVSFGAELTVRTYLDQLERDAPQAIVAQPCPAIVSYVELKRPELLPFLAKGDSPMLHTIKMIREFMPDYARHRVAVISPCLAKKREFVATGHGDYNVTMDALRGHFERHGIDLARFPEADFANPPAERAVLFSSPGGLLETAKRWNPDIGGRTRKIEGPSVYPYLDGLHGSIRRGEAPLLVDCLSCEKGCNGGPGTRERHTPVDVLEHRVARRAETMKTRYREEATSEAEARKTIEARVAEVWRPGLYERRYQDRSRLVHPAPSSHDVRRALALLEKHAGEEINCNSCGYGSCQKMAEAIAIGRNKPENCHHLLAKRMAARQMKDDQVSSVNGATRSLKDSTEFLASSVVQMAANMQEVSRSAEKALAVAQRTAELAASSHELIAALELSGADIGKVVEIIRGTANRLNLLSLNALIQAARAGQAGAGFAVVAAEVQTLAGEAAGGSASIEKQVNETRRNVGAASVTLRDMSSLIAEIAALQGHISASVSEQADVSAQVEERIHGVSQAVGEIASSLEHLTQA